MPLGQFFGNVDVVGAYEGQKALNEQRAAQQLQQYGALQRLMMARQSAEDERQFRSASLGLKERELTQTSADRAAARAVALQQWDDKAKKEQVDHEFRLGQLRTQQERDAEVVRHNRVAENLQRIRVELEGKRAANPQQPRAPTGYRYKADDQTQLEAIPGGPEDVSGKTKAKQEAALRKADVVIGKIDEALKLVSPWTTGLVGDIRGTLPGRITGSGAYTLDRTIDTIKANLGFSELQAMRESSPTGGALGQVAVMELQMLQSTISSLEKGQNEETLRNNLEQVKTHFNNWKAAVAAARKQEAGGAPAAPTGWTPDKERRYQELLRKRGGAN